MQQRDIDHLVDLAAQNICDGVIEEPRVYYDSVPLLVNGAISTGDPSVFINGEQFPVRITQMSFGFRATDGNFIDERALADVGVRFVFHDSYYQTSVFVPPPLWSDKIVSGPAALTQGFSSYTFDRPLILSARDTLRVQVALEAATDADTTRRATVAFYGTGVQSKRPYFLSSARDLSTTAPVVMSGADYRNDGTEPIALTDMVVQLSGQTDDPIGGGDVRLLRVQVRQIGNGTGADWFVGPQTPAVINGIPAQLLGFTEGRVVVHQIQGEGLLWEPGEGIRFEAVDLVTGVADGFPVAIALSGYISLV